VSSGPGEPAAPAIVVLLDRLAEWQAHEGEPIEAALGAIEDEERSARRRLEDAQRQAAALASLRREQEELRHQLEMESLRRRRDGVRDALAVDRSLLEARAGELLELLAARDRELGLLLAAPALAPAVSGYLDATDRLAGARGTGAPAPEDLLPPEDRALLEPYLRAAIAPPPSLGAPPAGVGVVISTDPPQGRPEALLVVLPVPWSVYAGATSRPEDLCTLLAYRLVQELQACWRTLDCTVEEGLRQLDSLCITEVWVCGKISGLLVPNGRANVAKLLELAQVEIPRTIKPNKANMHTKTKLKRNNK
jgi:hypothetical protein